MVLVEAKVTDSTHLELSAPLAMNCGKTVFVTVAESLERDRERRQWADVSSVSLVSAYGDFEPEYTSALVREKNADYGS
jgi:hypothetical protein